MKKVLLVFFLIMTGCVSTTKQTTTAFSDALEIIRAAAESGAQGIEGVFTLKIVATGIQDEFVYLNTELDYRDQRSVSVVLHPKIISQLIAKNGVSPQEQFLDQTIVVRGQAKRVKIKFISNDQTSNKYYYQTHIRLMDISQIEAVYEHAQ